MAKAIKLPSGKWRCKANYTDENGKYRAKSFTAESKVMARSLADDFLLTMEYKKKPENKTIGELTDKYLDNLSNTLSPSTLLGYRKFSRSYMKKESKLTGLLSFAMYGL